MEARTLELVQLTARELGGQWTAQPRLDIHWQARLVREDGARLLVAEAEPGRVEVTSTNPVINRRQVWIDQELRLTFKIDRGPAALARDITRKIMPGYEQLFAHARSTAVAQRDAAERSDRILSRLAGCLPAWTRTGTGDIQHEQGGTLITMNTGTDGYTVGLALTGLTPDQAAVMVSTYAELTGGN
ncbi:MULTISPECIES: hypothetical protein [unclassified Streptomyces]|uniref:hypothetical protein n=1 Tax=unclassified Streptomyces TaxID=2593676 RepID=UPI0035D67A22